MGRRAHVGLAATTPVAARARCARRCAGPPDTPRCCRRPADLEVAQSLGVETVLSATVESAERGLLTLRIGSRSLRAVDVDAGRPGARVFACIRAEDVLLERQLSPAASARNQVPARVVAVNRDGPLERVALDCGFPLVALITQHAREEMELVEGSTVIAAIKAISVHLVPRS